MRRKKKVRFSKQTYNTNIVYIFFKLKSNRTQKAQTQNMDFQQNKREQIKPPKFKPFKFNC